MAHRLPGGDTTSDTEAWIKAWRAFAVPGFHVYGWDDVAQTVTFSPKTKTLRQMRLSPLAGVPTYTVPVALVRAIGVAARGGSDG